MRYGWAVERKARKVTLEDIRRLEAYQLALLNLYAKQNSELSGEDLEADTKGDQDES